MGPYSVHFFFDPMYFLFLLSLRTFEQCNQKKRVHFFRSLLNPHLKRKVNVKFFINLDKSMYYEILSLRMNIASDVSFVLFCLGDYDSLGSLDS